MDEKLHDLLAAYRSGTPGALDSLVPLIYDDLRRIARRHVRQWPGLTLNTTGVVHETYLKLARQHSLDANDRAHFMVICSHAMRQFIVSHARGKYADKRGALAETVTLDDVELPLQAEAEELLTIDQALKGLAEVDPRLVRVFECRYFGGYSAEETSEALGVPLRTVQRDWLRARAWLLELLSPS